jgi:hypothetical protein
LLSTAVFKQQGRFGAPLTSEDVMKQLELWGIPTVAQHKQDVEIAWQFDWHLIRCMMENYRRLYMKHSGFVDKSLMKQVVRSDIDPFIEQIKYYEKLFDSL